MRRLLTWCVIAVIVCGCARKVKWTEFSPTGSKLTVSAPGEMVERFYPGNNSPNGQTHVYMLETSNDRGYVVAVTTFAAHIKLNATTQDAVMKTVIPQLSSIFASKGVSTSLDREQNIAYPKGQAKEVHMRPSGSGKTWIRARIYVGVDALRQIYVYGTESDINGAHAQRFLDSVVVSD